MRTTVYGSLCDQYLVIPSFTEPKGKKAIIDLTDIVSRKVCSIQELEQCHCTSVMCENYKKGVACRAKQYLAS